MVLAAANRGWPDPLLLEGLRERFLPETTFRGRQNHKLQFAVLAAAALHGGAEPDLLDEVAWWQTDDFWQYALFAAIAYIRAAANRASVPVRQACQHRAVGSACKWPREAAACGTVSRTDHTDQVQVRRAYKFRAYPTQPQESRAVRLLRDHCDLYNAALMERREAWRMRKENVSYGTQSAQLKDIRKADPDGQGRHSFTAQQQTLRRLNTVFAAFYGRVTTGGNKPGYPRFKPYQRFSQVMFVAGDGAKWQPRGTGKWARATFQAVGAVKVRQHR